MYILHNETESGADQGDRETHSDGHTLAAVACHTSLHRSAGAARGPQVGRSERKEERERGRDGQTMYTLAHTHLLSTEADVGLGKLGGGEVETALGAGPAELLPGKQLRGEEGEPSLPVPGPLLDALQVEQTIALHTTPHLRRGGRGEGERGRYGHINISISA